MQALNFVRQLVIPGGDDDLFRHPVEIGGVVQFPHKVLGDAGGQRLQGHDTGLQDFRRHIVMQRKAGGRQFLQDNAGGEFRHAENLGSLGQRGAFGLIGVQHDFVAGMTQPAKIVDSRKRQCAGHGSGPKSGASGGAAASAARALCT